MTELGKGIPGRVSIIMTTYNSIEHIRDSLDSILSQNYPDLEIAVADGGSTDGTVEIIRKYAATVGDGRSPETADLHQSSGEFHRCMKWVSGPDHGIYDGMNKAIRMSTGEIIAVCNDLFTTSEAVSTMVAAIRNADNAANVTPSGSYHIIGAHADLAYMDGSRVVRKWRMGEGRIEDGWLPAHPTMYLKREVYEQYGLYDLNYRSSSDYEFMVRVLRHPENHLVYVPEELIHMYYGGTSNKGFRGYFRNTREAYDALKANEIPHPGAVICRRIIRTLHQFSL